MRRSANGEKVRPLTENSFWVPGGLSIVDSNGPFLEYLHDVSKMKVHCAGVGKLEGNAVHLSTGQVVDVGAVIYATGWEKNSSSLFSMEDAVKLGLPVTVVDGPKHSAKEWGELDGMATYHVRQMFPALFETRLEFADRLSKPKTTPYRLFRQIIPIDLAASDDRSIAFTGTLKTSQTKLYAELSALYAMAWMEGLLPEQTEAMGRDQMRWDVPVGNAFMRARVSSLLYR